MKSQPDRFALPFIRRSLIGAAVLALCAAPAFAVTPFVVKDIRIEGIQRTEAGTVFTYLPVRVGETFDDDKSIAAIKALYATGFFKDIRLEEENGVLVVLVEERPAINTVDFTGTKEFEKDMLIKALKDIGVGEAKIYDKASVDRAEQELKRQYLSHGLYGVKITTTITPIERNRVNVMFNVDEGDIATIRGINIVGNKAFSDKELREVLALSTSGWFTWYSKADQYSKTKLTGDLEAIKSYYLDRGYLEATVESTQVSITPDKKDIYLTINITEGEKYTVSSVKLEGETFGREEELRQLILLQPGKTYSGALQEASNKRISARLGQFGYAFANVNADPQIDREKREVAFTFVVDPGKRAYVRHMNISGNTVTRDEVIRREFRQFESAWYDADKVKLSRDRVDRLGYFKEVKVDTPESPGTSDQVDINLSVEERPTGNFTVGGSFSQAEKFTFTASIQQQNFAGSGQTVGIDLNTSKYSRTIAFSNTNPYFTDDGVSRAFQVYLRTTRPPLSNIGSYTVRQAGGNMTFGVPFSESDTVYFGAGLERTTLETDASSPLLYQKLRGPERRSGERYRYRQEHLDPADRGLGPRHPRQSDHAEHRPLPARQPRSRRHRRLEILPRRLRAAMVPSGHFLDDAGPARRARLRQGLRRQLVSGLQELLRRRHRLGARLRKLDAGRGRSVLWRRHRRLEAHHRQCRTAVPVPGQHQGPQPALVHLRRRRPGVPGKVEDLSRRDALLGRYRPVLDFPGRSAALELC